MPHRFLSASAHVIAVAVAIRATGSVSRLSFQTMCNVYHIGRHDTTGGDLAAAVSELAASLPSPLVRKTDPGVVALAGGRVETMRWGFHRAFNPAVNNARADKLDSGMWREACRERRCAVPMSSFYEWGPALPQNTARKQAHEFLPLGDGYLWVAGIWESHPEIGRCYSIVTTEAAPPMTGIHHRMPALLAIEEIAPYLDGAHRWPFQAAGDRLAATPCESPLKQRIPSPPEEGLVQGELF